MSAPTSTLQHSNTPTLQHFNTSTTFQRSTCTHVFNLSIQEHLEKPAEDVDNDPVDNLCRVACLYYAINATRVLRQDDRELRAISHGIYPNSQEGLLGR